VTVDSTDPAVPVTGASAPVTVDRTVPAVPVTGPSAPVTVDSTGAAVLVSGPRMPPTVEAAGPAVFVTGASAPPNVDSAGPAVFATGASAPPNVDSAGPAVFAGPSVTGDAVGGVVFAAGGPLRFGSTGAVLVTAACAPLADDVVGAAVGVCVTAGTSGPAALVLVTGGRP
jgi:hypothetical protein